MALLSITAQNQWWSDTNGAFRPHRPGGGIAMIGIRLIGAPTAGTVIQLRDRRVGETTWNVIETFSSADVPFRADKLCKDGWEFDLGVPTGGWVGGTLGLELI